MEWKKLTLLIMLVSWFTSAVYSNTVYISTTANSSCSRCLTISQFANRFSGHHEPNTTAVLLPGNHILKENLVIQNVLFLSIVAVDSKKKEEEICLSCAEGASITFQSTTNVNVRSIAFIGCRAIKVKNVEQFILEGSIFKSMDDSPGSGLIAFESSIIILRTSFLNLIGSVWNSSSICRYAEMCPVEVGGAIIGLRSTVVIFDSVFKESRAELGGAIYSESSYLVIVNCNFFGHKRACKYLCIGGAIFSDKSSVAISMCNFVGNKFNHVSNSVSIKGGALGFTESFILINRTNLFDNNAHRGGALYTLTSLVFIDNTCFMDNKAFSTGAGMHTDTSYIHMNNSNFIFNFASKKGTLNAVLSYINVINSNFYSNRAEINGGAIKTVNCTIIVSQSMIVNNTARKNNGGGIEATHNSTAVIDRTIIKGNMAGKSGGGIKTHHDSKLIFLDKVVVKNNTAWYGAAVHLHFTTLKCSGMLIVANNSATLGSFVLLYSAGEFMKRFTLILENNTGSLLIFNSHVRGKGEINIRITHNKLRNFTMDPKIQEGSGLTCILGRAHLTGKILIEHNSALNGGAILAISSGVVLEGDITLRGNSVIDTGGAVYAYHSGIKMNGYILVEKNVAMQKGGGIHSVSSSLTLIHDDYPGASITYLHFVSNSAKLGGGVCLEISSKMYLITRERLVHFVGNQADYGGAIYIADKTNIGTCTSSLDSITAASESECFFQSITPQPHLITINKLFSFSNNMAKYSGSILYGGLLDRCTVNAMTKKHITYSSLPRFMESIRNYTNSDAVRVCFCQDRIADCSYQPKPIKIMKGKQFNVEVVAVDQTNNSLSGKIWSYLLNFENYSSFGHRQWHQNVNPVCTNLTFAISSSKDTEVLHLYPEGPCKSAGISTRRLRIEFIPCSCPIGFEVSKENRRTCKCDCNTEINQFVSACNATTSLLTRKGNSWFNKIRYQNETHFLTYDYCPFDYCVPALPEVSINLSIPNGADSQCAFDRSGVLCGKCKPGHSLSLGSSRCLKCPSYWTALLAVIIITALLSGLALVVFILYLNLTVAVGSLNALIFYANIMLANKSVLLPANGPTFDTLFIAWMNLDFGIDLCIIDEMDMYTKSWMQLAFPIYVISLLFSIIIACKVSTKFSNFIGRKNPVATLATLILLSYTKLLQSIIVVLSFAHLIYPDHTEIVWLADASVKYLHGKHIPLFIAAVVILLLGTAYTLLLISWQWLMKFSSWRLLRWVKNTKLISFMDAYNAPYHPRSRYWTGLLLLARVILYLVSALNPSKEPRVNFIAIMVVICSLLALSTFHVYKKCILNILEIAILYNIILISVIQMVAYETNRAASYVSVSISFMTLLCLIIYHVFTMTAIRKWLLKRVSHCLLEEDASDDRTRRQHVVTHTEVTLKHATEQN